MMKAVFRPHQKYIFASSIEEIILKLFSQFHNLAALKKQPCSLNGSFCVDICSYQKFAKGKDLSRYHSTDLNCIFGERKKKVARTERQRTDEVK